MGSDLLLVATPATFQMVMTPSPGPGATPALGLLFQNPILERHACRVMGFEPFVRGVHSGEYLQMIGVANLFARIDVNPNCFSSKILSQSFEKRMTHLAFGRLGPVLDLSKERRLNPYSAMRDFLCVGLCLAN
jgi:hypothetical protein